MKTRIWIIGNYICWYIGSSRASKIGIDPIYGVSGEYMIP